MSVEHLFDDGGKARPKPSQEAAGPEMDNGPLTKASIDGKLDAGTVTKMQQTMGNAAVQRLLAQRSGSGPTEISEETTGAINSQRGAGQSLDDGMAAKAGGAMGQDFSGVTVHTDSSADNLSRQLGAKAFTTGSDIFFREGAYNPKSSEGQHLIAHELTHVVQQGASAPSVQGKMTVNDPNDQYEAEADAVANTVMNHEEDSAQREAVAPDDEIQEMPVQREAAVTDDEIQEMPIQREAAVTDDEIQEMPVQREAAVTDDEIQEMPIQREGAVEEDEVAPPPAAEAETQEVAPGEAAPEPMDAEAPPEDEAMLMPDMQRQEEDELKAV
jgi:hypothetical protein